MPKVLLSLAGTALAAYLVLLVVLWWWQRALLYFPSHDNRPTSLRPWVVDNQIIGYSRTVSAPSSIWLMLHGNGGQASHRDYVLPLIPAGGSFYVLEYPGYGGRPGSPSRESFTQAAEEAYQVLRREHPDLPIGIIGESLGSGPAAALSSQSPAPNGIFLVVPFADLADVAAERFWFVPVRWLLRDRWHNPSALRGYRGQIEIFAATFDTIIPYRHAQALASTLPNATFHRLDTGHNDWSSSAQARFRLGRP